MSNQLLNQEMEPAMFEKEAMVSNLAVVGNNTNTANLMSKILGTLSNYFYNETKISPEHLKLIYPYLVLTSMSYEELKKMFKLEVVPKLLSKKEYICGKDSFELEFVFGGLGYNTKEQFIFSLAFQKAYEKEFETLDIFKNMDWFVKYCKENGLDNPEEMIKRFDIINLFYIHMQAEKREVSFPFNILERALLILNE
jgi:hypothetical protein